MKQQSWNSSEHSTCLITTATSKACAKQRTGRAGRIRNGFSYRLYSAIEYKAMEPYTVPEIQRVSLTDICLKTKKLCGEIAIEEYLMRAIHPPPVHHIRQV